MVQTVDGDFVWTGIDGNIGNGGNIVWTGIYGIVGSFGMEYDFFFEKIIDEPLKSFNKIPSSRSH